MRSISDGQLKPCDDRLSTVTHSTLGAAMLTYDAEDRLSYLTLGNDAYTTYTYDAYNRLTAFDVVDAAAGRLIKQDWAYDALGRKGHTGGGGARYLNVSSAYVPNGQYKIAYDAASRLTREYYGSTSAFNRVYIYDDAGNRGGDYIGYGDWYFMTGNIINYSAGNREDSFSYTANPGKTPLSYDFKGNVTGREMLWQSAAFSYEWDVYDRLTTATQTGENWTVNFNYDALGRMLRRGKSGAGTGDNVTYDYWLGLNKIAQESGGAGAEICVPDNETGATPAANGWYPRSNGAGVHQSIAYEEDAVRGRVLKIENTSTTTTAKYILGDYASGTQNPNDDDFNTTRTVLSMWVKGDGTNYFNLAVLATTNLATRFLYLNATDGSDLKYAPPSASYEFRIGAGYRAARWQYLEVDLAARVDGLEPGETISRIDAIIPIVGRYLAIDDIKLADGRLSRSWAQVPGAALGGYLGAQTGAAGATGVSAWDKYYYHFSDLGTVMATTDSGGAVLGVYQPDFWGNYREVYGVRPDTMGLTGKFYDEDIHASYHGYRWLDTERGRWMSEEPTGFDGPNLYHFVFNRPMDYVDYNGLEANHPDWYNPYDWLKYGLVIPFMEYVNVDTNVKSIASRNNQAHRVLGSEGSDGSEELACIADLGTDIAIEAALGGLGLGFTKHGINQVINRGIKPDLLRKILTHGRRIQREDGTYVIVYRGYTAVFNELGQLITIFIR